MGEYTEVKNVHPEGEANFFSLVFLTWLSPVFQLCRKHLIDINSLYRIQPQQEASYQNQRLENHWNEELKKPNPSLVNAIAKTWGSQTILAGVILMVGITGMTMIPMMIGHVIDYFQPDTTMTALEAYLLCFGIVLGASMGYFCITQHQMLLDKVVVKSKAGINVLLYKRLLKLRSSSTVDISTGDIINFFSTDIEKVDLAVEFIHSCWVSAIQMLVIAMMLFYLVGVVALFGFMVLIIMGFVCTLVDGLAGKLRQNIARQSGKRLQLTTQLISGIRVFKMYCWEAPFGALIAKARKSEYAFIGKSIFLRGTNNAARSIGPRLAVLSIVVAARNHDVSIPLMNLIQLLSYSDLFFSLVTGISISVTVLITVQSSLQRMSKFLLISDVPGDKSTVNDNHPRKEAIYANIISASWDQDRESSKGGREFSLNDVFLTVPKGSVVAVVGPVGSGKSSLLMTLMKELIPERGFVCLNGTCGYFSQQPWVFGGTVQENIIYGKEMVNEKYRRVIQVCGLSRDLQQLSNGDQTQVGERGSSLSGGQRARVALARAVYMDADNYLLDDPLSAVDTKVGKQIFNECIMNQLSGKTRILVTHQLQYLKQVDWIVCMDEGSVVAQGKYEDIQHEIGCHLPMVEEKKKKSTEDDGDDEEEEGELNEEPGKPLTEEEDNEMQNGEINSLGNYAKAGGLFFGLVFVVILIAAKASYIASDLQLIAWSSMVQPVSNLTNVTREVEFAEWRVIRRRGMLNANLSGHEWPLNNHNVTSMPSTGFPTDNWTTTESEPIYGNYTVDALTFYVYVGFYFLYVILSFLSDTIFSGMLYNASLSFHRRMLKSVINAKVSFFDKTPAGNIINRFARDMGMLDEQIPLQLHYFMSRMSSFAAFVFIPCLLNPYIICGLGPIVVATIYLQRYVAPLVKYLRRIEAKSKNKVYSYLSDSIYGLPSIRALGMEEHHIRQFVDAVNTNTTAFYLTKATIRWFSIRCNFLLDLFLLCLIVINVAMKDSLNSGTVGLSLVYAVSCKGLFDFSLKMWTNVENEMVSVERVVAYTDLPQEPQKRSKTPPPKGWPRLGTIRFDNVCVRYAPEAPLALKNLNFNIRSGEKVGVVGRTGAGKSSLIATLFRLSEPTGKIWIDGIDISKIGLHELRGPMSVIPQEPVLFDGSLRKNLDPFDEYDDLSLWLALQKVNLITSLGTTETKLDMVVQEAGKNFSTGERQLLCLARAIVRQNQIIVMDEATANIDQRTDALIQRTLRETLNARTVITVAHRLETVIDFDRIMVLDYGELIEFDTPSKLLTNPDGHFTKMVNQSGPQYAARLRKMADEAAQKRASRPDTYSDDVMGLLSDAVSLVSQK